MDERKDLTQEQSVKLLAVLKARFEENKQRHKGIDWAEVQAKLEACKEKLRALNEMENTGGEPDVVGRDEKTGAYIFCDCAAETPAGRRNLCYDPKALETRKANKPQGSAVGAAAAMGVEMLKEEEYRALQQLGEFDLTTSSWVETPEDIREKGGALFCDRRYGHVFVYHNGAESYYSSRGFRGLLRV